jgi:TRAP-type C4-dicarboxylate transport system substrate-binding protein
MGPLSISLSWRIDLRRKAAPGGREGGGTDIMADLAGDVALHGHDLEDVAANQQPDAYASGAVDVGMTSLMAFMARNLHQSMKTITRTGHAASNYVVAVNENYWRSLTDGQRTLLLAAAQAADTEAARRLVAFEDAVPAAVEKQGVKIVSLSRRDLQLWRICSSDVLMRFMTTADAAGEKLIAAYARLLQDPCCNKAETHGPEN